MKKRISLFLIGYLASQFTFAQGAEMADTMRSEGKIYVVVAIALTIFAGIVFYLFRIDRRLHKLEKQHTGK